jgi:paraquat-inducible protein B
VDTGSLETVLLGGVAFGVPEGLKAGTEVTSGTEFKLYSSYEETLKNPFRYRTNYAISFSQSIKGLQPGAPVEYRGIPIGKVERILLKESLEHSIEQGTEGEGDAIAILVSLEPGRLELPDRKSSIENLHNAIRSGVGNGMRASLETASLLTGAKYINIDYFEDVEPAEIGSFFEYPTIPVIETGLGQLEHKLTAILDKLNAMPLEETVHEANSAIATLNKTLVSLDTIMQKQSTQQLPENLNDTLQELRTALKGFSPDSEAYQSINSSLLRLNRTLGNMESLTRTLSGKPNAAILPSNPIPDPIPEVKQQ